MNNISYIHSCYGCAVCAIACPKKIIDIHLNSNGFYEPYITDESKCVNCGLCLDVCSYTHTETALKEKPKVSYGAWSREVSVRRVSASGGVGFEIGRYLIGQGYKAIGVKYSLENRRAEHYVAETVEDFIFSMGSKYIQSYTLSGFKGINRKDKFLITGTPCQIDSLRRYICRMKCEEHFILMDFFCHGVPSSYVWHKYIKEQQKVLGLLEFVSWRNKLNGWHDSWAMVLDGSKQQGEVVDWHDSYNMLIKEKKSFINSRWTQGDAFYNMFLGNNCLGKACYKHCKFKYDCSSADVRIGDMWGNTYATEDKGVTACVAFTERGKKVLMNINCELNEYPFEQVAEGQIKAPITYPLGWSVVIQAAKSSIISMKQLVFISRVVGKINKIIK